MFCTKVNLPPLFVAAIVVVMACASKSGDIRRTDDGLLSAGTSSVAGSQSKGRAGANTGTGGPAGSSGQSGGMQGSGGAGANAGTGGPASSSGQSGGMQGSGGSQVQGGKQATGGSRSSSDSVGGGATVATGGTKSTGGAVGTGGTQPNAGSQGVIRTRKIEARGFTFDALEAGTSGEPVLLLHGFPDTSLEWSALMTMLAANGYHCLAPDQRGYSPGARPTEVGAYIYSELVADAFAFADELGERFHVVAHDWGANVAWLMLQKSPSRVASFTTISVPHYRVWARAVYNDPDMAGYLSMLNTWMTPGKGEAFWTASAMRNMWTAKPVDQREATIAHMMEPGTMTAALNWYRASDGHKNVINDFNPWEVSVPTLLVFGTDDIGQKTVTDTAPFMTGHYRVVQPKGGHFIVDEQPKAVADETLAQLRAYPIK